MWPLRATAPQSRGAVCGLLRHPPPPPRPWHLRGLGPPYAPFSRHRDFLSCSTPLSPHSSFPSLITLHHSAMAPARALCYASCFCCPTSGGFTPVHSGRSPHPVALVTALTWTHLCPGLLPRHFASSTSFPRQPLSVPPLRLVPDHAPRRVLPRARCSAGALAASRERSGGTREVLPWEATVASNCLPGCRLSVTCGPRSAVFRAALARGRALPLASALPWHTLLHRHQQLLAPCVRCPSYSAPANARTHFRLGPRPSPVDAAPCRCSALGVPTHGKTHGAARYITHLRLALMRVTGPLRSGPIIAPPGKAFGPHGSDS